MQNTNASGIPIQWSVSWGVAFKADGPLSFPKPPFGYRPIPDIQASQDNSHKRPFNQIPANCPRRWSDAGKQSGS